MSKNKRKYIKSSKNQRRTRNGPYVSGKVQGSSILERLKHQIESAPHKCKLPASVIKYIANVGKL